MKSLSNPKGFVLSSEMLHDRIKDGGSVRRGDVPVDEAAYTVLTLAGGIADTIQTATVTETMLRDGGELFLGANKTLARGDGPKAYLVGAGMDGSLAPRLGFTLERKNKVCEALAKCLYYRLEGSRRSRPDTDIYPTYHDLVSPANQTFVDLRHGDLIGLGIGFHPGEDANSTLIDWIQSEVGPMLTQLLAADDDHKDDNFTSSWISVTVEDCGSGQLRFKLIRSENQASDGE